MLIDPWWNPSIEEQAIDRVHRLGQTQPVSVYRFVCQGTVEERLLLLQEKKKRVCNSALGGGVGGDEGGAKLSMDELVALLQ